jgi:hypothetical protein
MWPVWALPGLCRPTGVVPTAVPVSSATTGRVPNCSFSHARKNVSFPAASAWTAQGQRVETFTPKRSSNSSAVRLIGAGGCERALRSPEAVSASPQPGR